MREGVDGEMEEEQKRRRNIKQCTSEAMYCSLVSGKQAHICPLIHVSSSSSTVVSAMVVSVSDAQP